MTAEHSLASASRWSQYIALTKPRVVQLIVFCAVIGMFLAVPGLPNPAVVFAATLGIALGSVLARQVLAPRLGVELFPSVDAGQLQLRLRAPTGTRIERTELLALRVLDLAHGFAQLFILDQLACAFHRGEERGFRVTRRRLGHVLLDVVG